MPTHSAHIWRRKYEPLTLFLRRQSRPVVRMSFADIERVIAAKLPQSATRHRAWWSNNEENSAMTKAWKAAGFVSEDVDMRGRTVTFRRVRAEASHHSGAAPADNATEGRHPLIGWMKGTLTTAEGVDLTQPADAEWGEATSGDRTWEERE